MQQTDVELAIAAAAAGAVVVRERYGTPLTRFAKSGIDFATEVDIETEQVVKATIRAARPDDAILGEESGIDGPTDARRVWMVDPLCGTLNYAAQTPLAAVNVAARMDGQVVAAAVADPLAGEIFWTDTTRAAARRNTTDTPLRPQTGPRLVDVNIDGPRLNGWFEPARLLGSQRFRASFAPRVLSTSLACTWVAAGRRAGYVTDGDLSASVHFAAAIALCQATGCRVTDLRGEPVHSGAGGLVAAADAETHAALLELVAEQADLRP